MAEDFSSKISLHPLDETVCLHGEDVEDLSQFEDYPSSAERETHVFWDVVQYPIPPNANLKSVRSGIISALDQMGFYGSVSINAYGGRMNHSKDDLYKARILHIPQGEGEMAVDLILFAHTRSPRNFMVIPKPDPGSELHRVLKCLQTRHHNLLLVNTKPKAHQQDCPFLSDSVSVQSVVDCTQGLDGGRPIIGGIRMKDTLPVIKDLPSLEFLFHRKLNTQRQGSERKAFVFWDVVKYPIPTYANIINVGNDIRAALQRLGHHGCVEILAFGGDKLLNLNHLKDDLYKEARIICIPQGFFEKALHFFSTSLFHGPLMVIPKPDPGSDLDRVLTRLKERGYDVLSVKPPDDEDSPQDDLFLQYAQLILGCTYGLYEGKPIIRGRRKMKDIHVIQDFSKPITFEKGATAGVFWNLEDFPFPAGAGWKPDDIYKKIESAFRADGYELSNMLIWAYVDDKEGSWGGDFLKYKTWKSSIYFLPGGGDKSARRNRMLHDISLWATDLESPYYHFPAYLVLVSDQDKVREDEEFSCRLRVLMQSDYNVLVVSPTEKAHDSEWLPSPSTYTFGNERRIKTEGGIGRSGLIHSYCY